MDKQDEEARAYRRKMKIINHLLTLMFIAFFIASISPVFNFFSYLNHVHIKGREWSYGIIHLRRNLMDKDSEIDIPISADCILLDRKSRPAGLQPVIYFLKVKCDGLVGFVEVNQVN